MVKNHCCAVYTIIKYYLVPSRPSLDSVPVTPSSAQPTRRRLDWPGSCRALVCIHKSLCNGSLNTDKKIITILKFGTHNHADNTNLIKSRMSYEEYSKKSQFSLKIVIQLIAHSKNVFQAIK